MPSCSFTIKTPLLIGITMNDAATVNTSHLEKVPEEYHFSPKITEKISGATNINTIKGTIENLLKPKNKGELAAILTHHVLSGKVISRVVLGKKLSPKTVNGTSLSIDGTNGVVVSGAKVMTADVMASNGVIHVIDKVLLP